MRQEHVTHFLAQARLAARAISAIAEHSRTTQWRGPFGMSIPPPNSNNAENAEELASEDEEFSG